MRYETFCIQCSKIWMKSSTDKTGIETAEIRTKITDISVDNIVVNVTVCGMRWKHHAHSVGKDRWPKIQWN
jgi:hypothetical protein